MAGLIWLAVDRELARTADAALLHAFSGGPPALWNAVTVTADSIVRLCVAAVVGALLFLRGRRFDAALMLVAVGGGMALNEIAKQVVDRPRPDLLPHLDHVGVLSFPSGHSSGAMALGLALALIVGRGGRWILAALAYAFLVGMSRVALAVHWPSDVAAGWCFGAAWVLALTAVCGKWRSDRDRRSGYRRSPRY